MTSSLLSLAAAEGGHHRELPMPPIGYALVAFALFMLLLAFLWSFRNTAAKLSEPKGHHGEPKH